MQTIPHPTGDADGPLQVLVANLDYSDYLGRLAIARVFNGTLRTGEDVAIAKRDGTMQNTKITKLFSFAGLKRTDIVETELGDIVAVAGVEGINIGETITDVENPAPLPVITIDEPTIAIQFMVNTSPFAGREGQYVTSRNLRDRLQKELLTNVSLRVEDTESHRLVQGDGTGRAATGHPDRNDAARRVRTGRGQAGDRYQDGGRQTDGTG